MSFHGQQHQWMFGVDPHLLKHSFKSAQQYYSLNNSSELNDWLKPYSEMAGHEGRSLEDEWGHSQILIDPKKDYKGALISKILFSINNKLKKQNPSVYLFMRNLNSQRKQSKFSRELLINEYKNQNLDTSKPQIKKKTPKEPTKAHDLKASTKRLTNPMRNTLHSLMQKMPEKKTQANLNKTVPSESIEVSFIEPDEELSLSIDHDYQSVFISSDQPHLSGMSDKKRSNPTNCSNFSSKGAVKLELASQLQSLKHTGDKSEAGLQRARGFKSPEKPIFFRGEDLKHKPFNTLKSVIDSSRRTPHHKATESFELTCNFRDLSEELAIRSTDKKDKDNSLSFLKQKDTPKGKIPRKCLGDFLLFGRNNKEN